MKTESKILAGACAGLYFFLSAFYYKVDAGLQEMAKMNTTLAVAVAGISNIEKDVEENKQDIKKLETRVGYLESSR